MSPNDGLKVCTFNAKCDKMDYKCCIKDACYDRKCGNISGTPDSLLAALIAVTILPGKADIYNIQNVKNKCVVEHLLKEIARVKYITDELAHTDCHESNMAFVFDIACRLNSFPGLCADGAALRDALVSCKICDLDYVSSPLIVLDRSCDENAFTKVLTEVLRYKGIFEYDAYYSGTCLTLIKKTLCICPETREVPCVDALVLFFEHCERKFINVNVNLGSLVNSFEDVGSKKEKVDNLICFLKKYKDCGAVLMSGAFGDIDYDVRQLLFAGDGKLPELAQRLLADGIKESPVPSDFPCDLNDPIYECLEFLFRTCNAEAVPYSWLLQYLRLKGCKKCCLYKLVCNDSSRCDRSCPKKKCVPGCTKSCCRFVQNIDDCKKCPETQDCVLVCGSVGPINRSHLRQQMRKSDKSGHNSHNSHKGKRDYKDNHKDNHKNNGHNKNDKDNHHNKNDKDNHHIKKHDPACETPSCVPGNRPCCEPKCKTVCKNNCLIKYNKCICDFSKCEIKCRDNVDCDCCHNKHRVKVDTCKDLCKKSCCGSCHDGGKCEDDHEPVCKEECCEDKYCDTLTTFKRELCLYNSLDKVKNVNNRYTEFLDHFNRCLDCKYPRGMFQAWAMCDEYERPQKPSRVIDNNSELLALDHFLVSDCLKDTIVCASLSDLCIEKCGKPVKDLINDHLFNAVNKNPFTVGRSCKPCHDPCTTIPCTTQNCNSCCNQCVPLNIDACDPLGNPYVFEYGGSVVRSFFTHRVYCVSFEFPHKKKGCDVECGESLHGLGLTAFWSAICKYGSESVDIDVFERFGLDKHSYFRDFFWTVYPRKPCIDSTTSANHAVADKLVEHYSDCEDDALLYIQKKHDICEDEFYKHLLCVFSNTDTRDRFIVTIAFMEALYRTEKMKCIIGEDKVKILCNLDLVNRLFFLLSKCFNDRVKLRNFVGAQAGLFGLFDCLLGTNLDACIAGSDITKLFNCGDEFLRLGCLIDVLSFCLKDNCLLMEVLTRHAARSLKIDPNSSCGCNTDIRYVTDECLAESIVEKLVACLPQCCVNNKVKCALRDLLCGEDPKRVVKQIVCAVGEKDVILCLFAIINIACRKFLIQG